MKTTNSYFRIFILVLFSITLFSSCSSNELKNNEATSLVSQLPNEVVKGNIEIRMSGWRYYQNKDELDREFNSQNSHLIQRGILTNPVASTFQKFAEPLGYQLNVDFTNMAKPLILGRGNEPYQDQTFTVNCGELKFVEVVGIFQEEKSKTAEIEYKVEFIPSMFAEFATMHPNYEKGKTYSRKIIAKQYDSGWKIEN